MREIILGLIQGLTEFLPISSSGHLVLVPKMLGWEEPAARAHGDAAHGHPRRPAHLLPPRHPRAGPRGARAGARPGRRPPGHPLPDRRDDPGGVRRACSSAGSSRTPSTGPTRAASSSSFTALILIATERYGERAVRHELDDKRAFGIGAAQALAILPGLSRSGSTIGAGLLAGLTREEATRFSFLLSIPAIAGAGVLDVAKGELVVTGASIAGTVVAGVVGFLSIHYLLRFVRTHSLTVFCWYLFIFAPLSALVIWLR